jgi:palmitoyltransferase ZDHHC9/14/18
LRFGLSADCCQTPPPPNARLRRNQQQQLLCSLTNIITTPPQNTSKGDPLLPPSLSPNAEHRHHCISASLMTSTPRHSLTVRTPISPTSSSGGLPLSIHEEEDYVDSRHVGTYSVISSRMTDISDNASDIMGLAEAQQSQSQASPRNSIPGRQGYTTRISVGEMMDQFSTRPSTAMSNTTGGTRNWPSVSGGTRGHAPSSHGGSLRGRPTSSASRTHAPGVANQAFYRPMSSAKLQAQRGNRVAEEDEAEQRRIRGFAQAATATQLPTLPQHIPIVHQTGSEYNQRQASVSTVDHTIRTAPSLSSTAPLHDAENAQNRQRPVSNGAVSRIPQQRSSRGGTSSNESGSSSPPKPPPSPPNLGKNYEYFPGNMRFCFGGRFQTARDFPMNTLTGILVVLPSVLFFSSSCDSPYLLLVP